METTVQPWRKEQSLWPLPDSIPAEIAATFPADEAVELLVRQTLANFASEAEARESAIGFVNSRRRKLAGEHAQAHTA